MGQSSIALARVSALDVGDAPRALKRTRQALTVLPLLAAAQACQEPTVPVVERAYESRPALTGRTPASEPPDFGRRWSVNVDGAAVAVFHATADNYT